MPLFAPSTSAVIDIIALPVVAVGFQTYLIAGWENTRPRGDMERSVGERAVIAGQTGRRGVTGVTMSALEQTYKGTGRQASRRRFEMNKALVTGAAGFIGSNVVRVLLDEGVEVRAMVLPGEDQRNISGLDIEVVEGNVLDPPSLAKAIKGCDTLFHLAGIYSIWRKDRGDYYRVNLQGSRNMLWRQSAQM